MNAVESRIVQDFLASDHRVSFAEWVEHEWAESLCIVLEKVPDGWWAFVTHNPSIDQQMQDLFGVLPQTLEFQVPDTTAKIRIWKHSPLSLGLSSLASPVWRIHTNMKIPISWLPEIDTLADPVAAPDKFVETLLVYTNNSDFPRNELRQGISRFAKFTDEEFVNMRKCFLCTKPAINIAIWNNQFFGVCLEHSDDRNQAYQKQAGELINRINPKT